MADYLTQADLTARFGGDIEVSFLTGTEDTGAPDTDVLDEVIAAAEGVVNMSLAVRYLTPVSSSDAATTAAVKHIALDLAELYLRSRRSLLSDVKEAALQAIIGENGILDKLARGLRVLPGAAVPESTASRRPAQWSDTTRVLADTSGRVFGRKECAGL